MSDSAPKARHAFRHQARRALRRGGPIDWALRLLVAVYLALMVEVTIESPLALGGGAFLTIDGIGLDRMADGRSGGYFPVRNVNPEFAGDRAGIRIGDRVRYDLPLDYTRAIPVGEEVGVTVERSGQRRHVVMRFDSTRMFGTDRVMREFLVTLGTLAMLLVAGLLFWRGWWRPVPMLLAFSMTMMFTNSQGFGSIPFWASGLVSGNAAYLFTWFVATCALAALPVFAMRLYEERHHMLPRWQWRVCGALVAMRVGLMLLYYTAFPLLLPIDADGPVFTGVSISVGYGAAIAGVGYLLAGWLRSAGPARNQYSIILGAFTALLAAEIIRSVALAVGWWPRDNLHGIAPFATFALTSIVVPGLLAYAVLGKRLVDVGFVVNRTLVYGTVSAILLVAFGLAEWSADALIKEQSRVESAVIEAGVALGLFLAFHRVRDFVEKHLEALFFRSWHDNERALRRFLHEASYVTRADRLEAAFLAELRRFSGGGNAALYIAADQGYARIGDAAMGPALIDEDDPLAVSLRAHRAPCEPPGGDAALALPMLHRGDLLGLVLLGAKPNGDGYRPDEVELLAHAAHQIGLDLYALRVEAIERENGALRQEVSVMRDYFRGMAAAAAQ